jgi:pyridoxamine 5'-phosphate oxidase
VPGPDEQPLRPEDLDPDPLRAFQAWFAQAGQAGMAAPEAAAVATATPDGRPSVRMVLVKRVDERGVVFFTNYDSRKGQELAANPQAAVMFYWPVLGRSVRIEGPVAPTTREESVAYIRSRPRRSQISALVSPQSRPIADRSQLERRAEEIDHQHPPGDLPLPERWGGFRVSPRAYEFWQQRADRLHDRFVYLPDPAAPTGWRRERLAP